jgi:hypothetical protein
LTVAGLLVAVALPFEGSTLIGFLPGPKVSLAVDIATTGNPIECVAYMLRIGVGAPPDEVVEQIYVTAQFPGTVASYKFGAANATLLADRTEGVSAFVLGKDETGECTAKQAALTPSPDFTATQAGPRMIQIRGTKVLPRTMVSGLFVMSRKGPAFDPSLLLAWGFGFTVTKRIEEMPRNN